MALTAYQSNYQHSGRFLVCLVVVVAVSDSAGYRLYSGADETFSFGDCDNGTEDNYRMYSK